MSIVKSELIWRKSEDNTDTSSGGGYMTAIQSVDGVKNNIFPDVSQAERTAGVTGTYRKLHIHVANDADLTLYSPKIFVETITPGDDRVIIFPGTHIDTQATMTETQYYGAGVLKTTVVATDTEVVVTVENAVDDVFDDGMLFRISDKDSVDAETGNTEFIRLDAASAVSWNGNDATLTFTTATPAGLENGYTAGAKISSVIEGSDIVGAYASLTETTAGDGTYDDTTYPVLLDHIASVYDHWTLSFSSATEFTIAGTKVGAITGTWNTSANANPGNSDYSNKPYFILDYRGWTDTWANGDTLEFDTTPATLAIWYDRIIPAASDSLSGNKVIVGITGESE